VGVASSRVNPQERLVGGTMLVLAAEALAFPAGLIATILLTRYLLPADYGALALALAGVAWLEWTVVSLFSRAAWKLTAEADDWRTVAQPVVRVFLSAGLLAGVCVFATADLAARMLSVPQLAPLLRILALEIPVFVTAHAYRSVLIGRGMHGARAAVAAGRWTLRAILIAAGTLLGFSLNGLAVLIVAATCVELALARSGAAGFRRAHARSARPDRAAIRITAGQLLAYATPLAVSAICLRLLDRMDVFALRLFGGSLENVAAYGVAQNLALGPGLFGTAFVPALVAAYSYRAARGDAVGAKRLSAEALRAGFLMLALSLLAAGAARSLIELLFGARYAAAAPLFALLIVGAGATLLNALASAVLVGAGKLPWTVRLTVPLVLMAAIGHAVLVPRYGAAGAAIVTASTALIGAAASCVAAHVLVGTPIPFATLLRSLGVGGVTAWGLARLHVTGAAILPVLAIALLLFAVGLVLSGELRASERARLRALRRPAQRPSIS
jgi:O-antigen/teichoic acid export membrane protein